MNAIQRAFQRLLGIETRSSVPVSGLANPQAWLQELLGAASSAGISVTPENAYRLPVVYACTRVRAEALAALPVALYRRLPNGDSEPATDRAEHLIFSQEPAPWYSSYTLREVMQTHLDLQGNAYAQIVRNARGELIRLDLLHPQSTSPFWYNDELYYDAYLLNTLDTTRRVLHHSEVLHLVGPGSDGVKGRSPISVLRDTVGLGLAGQNMVGNTYKNKAFIPGFLSVDGSPTTEQMEASRDNWKRTYGGSNNAGETPVLLGGWKYNPVTLTPADAQWIEGSGLTTDQICGAFRVPPHMVARMAHSTNNNIEHQSLEFQQNCLLPIARQWEEQLNRKLLPARLRGQYYFRFNLDAALRADLLTRYRAHAIALNWGILNRDEVRGLENRNRIPDGLGAEYMQPLNMAPLGAEAPNGSNAPAAPATDDPNADQQPAASNAGN